MTTVRIGGASGYWGESDMALPQLLRAGDLDFIVFDYLAEITMSIMARAKAKDPSKGFASDFVTDVLRPNLGEIDRQSVRIIANAGGVNPVACGEAVRQAVAEAGLSLRVAVITGDDLLDQAEALVRKGHREMFSGQPMPAGERLASINAYLGAVPIATALDQGADIVITGRCVDSAVTLGACIHRFGWSPSDLDALAGGSLAGHIIECGPQATGGNHTDWEELAASMVDVGYPIAEIDKRGDFEISKPSGTGGRVTVGTVGEQMLYEIDDPQRYILPDVTCDFSSVRIVQSGANRVAVSGAIGRAAPAQYKVCATYADGWRAGSVVFFYGKNAGKRSRAFAENSLERARAKLRGLGAPDFDETLIEVVGDGSYFAEPHEASDVAVKIAVKHQDARAAGLLLREAAGIGLASAPGLTTFAGTRPKPSPVIALFSFLLAKSEVPVCLEIDGEAQVLGTFETRPCELPTISLPEPPAAPVIENAVEIPLERLAFLRSGDKGNTANVGVFPRIPELSPYIWHAMREERLAQAFSHLVDGALERFYLPGTGAMNVVVHEALGGGGIASLRNDPQGKAYSQILARLSVAVPPSLLERL